MSPRLLLVSCALLTPICGVALAHDDDPKILDSEPAYQGPGYRRALQDQPDSPLGGGNQELGNFSSNGVTLMSWIPLSEMAGNPSSGADCWGYTAPSGREYAIMCHRDGTTIVEVTNPFNATIVAEVSGPGSLWRDAKTYQDKLYVVSEGGSGIQIFDLANVDSGSVPQVGSVTSGGTTATHNVAIDTVSGYLYRTGGDSNGLRIYNLNASLTNPPHVASWSTRYVHDAQVVTYTSGPYAGREIVFACSGYNGGGTGTGLDVIDVTNKGNIISLDRLVYSGGAYSHQGWLSADRQYFHLGDELDETGSQPTTTHVIDVSNLNNIFKVGTYNNGLTAVGHNMYEKNGLMYQANYRSGLRVFDLNQSATNPPEVAYFDTYPGSNSANFNGLWSVYPYFDSGTVIGSDMERGLFVWKVGDPPLAFELPGGDPETVDPTGESVPVTIVETVPGQYVPGTAELHVNDGSGFVAYPMAELGGGNFTAPFPALPCSTVFQYYFSAGATDGNTWAYPTGAPATLLTAQAGFGVTVQATDDMESDTGWTVGAPGDDATTGIWVRVDPIATNAQPEIDHSPEPATHCWVTGQGSQGGSIGENDVDNGKTTLISPSYDLSGYAAPAISYWRWYSNNENSVVDDQFVVEISGNGSTWVEVERIGPAGLQANGGWFQNTVYVGNYITPTSNVRLRFIASDEGAGSIVEAAIDDLRLLDVDCGGCSGTVISSYCTSSPNSFGPGATAYTAGSTSITANDLVLNAFGVPPGVPGLFYYGPLQTSIPFGDGVRCVDGTPTRMAATFASGLGEVTSPVDFTAPPFDSGQGFVTAGDVRNFQFWYRDFLGGPAGFNTSDALQITFCP